MKSIGTVQSECVHLEAKFTNTEPCAKSFTLGLKLLRYSQGPYPFHFQLPIGSCYILSASRRAWKDILYVHNAVGDTRVRENIGIHHAWISRWDDAGPDVRLDKQ